MVWPRNLDAELKLVSQEWDYDETYLLKFNTSQFHTNKIVNEAPIFFHRIRPYEAMVSSMERKFPLNGGWQARTVNLDPQCYNIPSK